MMQEEDLKKRISELEKQNAILLTENLELKSENEFYKQDGIVGLYFSVNYQVNVMSRAIRAYNIDLGKADKGFERFWKAVTENGELAASLLSLEKVVKERLGVQELKEEDANAKVPNYMEQFIKDRDKKKK